MGRGDLARNLWGDPGLSAKGMGIGFLAQNAWKRSLKLNLKDPRGKAALKLLVAPADVLVENSRPEVMDRLGLGYEALKSENPRPIYCAISGFDQEGPWADRPAYDQIVQGVLGVMSITGDAESAPSASVTRWPTRGEWADRRDGDLRGAERSQARSLHRRLDARFGTGDDGLCGLELPRRRCRAPAQRQREHDLSPFRCIPVTVPY